MRKQKINSEKKILVLTAVLLAAAVTCSQSPLEKGAVCLRLGDCEGAVRFFGKALADDPGSYGARLGMGKALLQRAAGNTGDTLSWRDACMHLEAARTLSAGEALNPLLSQAWSERARQLLDKKDTIAALEALTRAIGYAPRSAGPLNAAGIIYFRKGELEKSRTLFARALSLDSANAPVLFNLGMAAWSSGAFEEARDFWLRCLKLAPSDETALYWFARAEKKKRDASETGRQK
ncbi:MAG: tetratricopeptide repeat protein [Chitinispirillaceae bacterium]|nr:tetratricopeptide repeat protein [Chitinispirillaceae bacterium]